MESNDPVCVQTNQPRTIHHERLALAWVTNSSPRHSATTNQPGSAGDPAESGALKTIANPNLTFIIPVHELVGLKDSKEFTIAASMMLANPQTFEAFDFLPLTAK
jgi:hypothetical protein